MLNDRGRGATALRLPRPEEIRIELRFPGISFGLLSQRSRIDLLFYIQPCLPKRSDHITIAGRAGIQPDGGLDIAIPFVCGHDAGPEQHGRVIPRAGLPLLSIQYFDFRKGLAIESRQYEDTDRSTQ